MPEVITVKRIFPEGSSEVFQVFEADTVPPRFATVGIVGDYMGSSGPLDREQLDDQLKHSDDDERLTDAEQAVADRRSFGCHIEAEEIGLEGDGYPGGRDRAALNLAKLVLAAS